MAGNVCLTIGKKILSHLAAQALEFERQHLQLQPPLRPGNAIMPVAAHAESSHKNPDGEDQQG